MAGFQQEFTLGLSSGTISRYGRYAIISYEIDFLDGKNAALDRYGVACGTLMEKLNAIAAAGFDGVEIFENDLMYFDGSPRT